MINEEEKLAIMNSVGNKLVNLIKNELNVLMHDKENDEKLGMALNIVMSLLASTLDLLTLTEPGYDAIMKAIVTTIKKDVELREE